jgi:hypothetical protein
VGDTAVAKLSCRLFVTQYGKSKLNQALGDQPVGTTLTAAARVTLPVGCYTWRVRVHEAGGAVRPRRRPRTSGCRAMPPRRHNSRSSGWRSEL